MPITSGLPRKAINSNTQKNQENPNKSAKAAPLPWFESDNAPLPELSKELRALYHYLKTHVDTNLATELDLTKYTDDNLTELNKYITKNQLEKDFKMIEILNTELESRLNTPGISHTDEVNPPVDTELKLNLQIKFNKFLKCIKKAGFLPLNKGEGSGHHNQFGNPNIRGSYLNVQPQPRGRNNSKHYQVKQYNDWISNKTQPTTAEIKSAKSSENLNPVKIPVSNKNAEPIPVANPLNIKTPAPIAEIIEETEQNKQIHYLKTTIDEIPNKLDREDSLSITIQIIQSLDAMALPYEEELAILKLLVNKLPAAVVPAFFYLTLDNTNYDRAFEVLLLGIEKNEISAFSYFHKLAGENKEEHKESISKHIKSVISKLIGLTINDNEMQEDARLLWGIVQVTGKLVKINTEGGYRQIESSLANEHSDKLYRDTKITAMVALARHYNKIFPNTPEKLLQSESILKQALALFNYTRDEKPSISANNFYLHALHDLGYIYEKLCMVPKTDKFNLYFKKSVDIYTKTAAKEYIDSYLRLGIIYLYKASRTGDFKDFLSGLNYLKEGYAKSSSQAQFTEAFLNIKQFIKEGIYPWLTAKNLAQLDKFSF